MSQKEHKKLKIAVLAYGSLTLNLSSPFYEEPLRVATSFERTPLEIWTSFQDVTAKEREEEARICLLPLSTPNELARKTPLFHALHLEEDLELAVSNFMKREGMEDFSQVAVIHKKSDENSSIYSSHSFEKQAVNEIEHWLLEEGYDVALIAQFHPKYEVHQVLDFAKASKGIQQRTLNYYRNLPPDTQEVHLEALEFLGFFSDDLNK